MNPIVDPGATSAIWFRLPVEAPGGGVLDALSLFTGDPAVASPESARSVFTHAEDFIGCSYGSWRRANNTSLVSLDPAVRHRPAPDCGFWRNKQASKSQKRAATPTPPSRATTSEPCAE